MNKQMKRFFFFVLCCVVSLAVTAQNTRSARGVVFDEKGTPMEGVKLTAVGTANSVVTGVDGTFDIAVATYTKYVEVSKEGYHSMQLEIDGSYLIARLQVDKKYAENKAKAEAEARKAAEAEKARLAAEAEAARLAAEEAEQARLAAEEKKRIEEEKRIAAEKAAAEKAEQARLAAEAKAKAEEEKRLAAEKAAAEKAEQARLAAEAKAKAEDAKRIAAEKAAAEKAEKARLAAEAKAKAEEEKRLAAEKAAAERAENARLVEQERLDNEKVVLEQNALKKAEQERIAAEKRERIEAEKARIEEEKRIAAEKAAAEKQKRVDAHKAYVEKWKSAELKGYRSQVEATFGLDLDLMCTSNIHYIGGCQINNILYIGIGTGVSLYLNDAPTPQWSANSYSDMANLPLNWWSVPVFGYFRANFANRRLTPFFALSAGYRFGTKHDFDMPWESYEEYSTGGVFINPQIGLNFRMTKKSDIYITAGFNLMQMPRFDNVLSTMFDAEFYKEFYGGFDLRLGFTF